jgi:bifunctional non-homologous end joining protein LigD
VDFPPLHWDEVKKGLKMKDFTIKNALQRIKKEGDIFKPVLGKGVNLLNLLKKSKRCTTYKSCRILV